MSDTLNKISIGTVLFFVFCAILFFVFYKRAPVEKYNGTDATPVKVLTRENTAFAEAERLTRAGQYAAARDAYERALAEIQDMTQEAQIHYKIAGVVESGGDYVHAIELFQKIAENPLYERLYRAYAVERLGIMYHTVGYGRPEITRAIFSKEPFTDFFDPEDELLSYRRLFEYASSFYPLAISQARIADWYAEQLYSNESLSTTTREQYLTIATYSIQLAKRDIERTKGDANANALIPTALTRIGVAQTKLEEKELIAKGEAEASFKAALSMYGILDNSRGQDNFVRFAYAAYLAITSPERVEDIQEVVEPFQIGKQPSQQIVSFFSVARTSSQLKREKNMLRIIAISAPFFKEYLISLGWQEGDFR